MQVLLPDCFTCITTAPQLNTLVLGAHRELFRVLGSRLPRTRVKNGSKHFSASLAPLRMPLSVGSTDVIAPNSVAVPQITPPCGVSTGPHVSTSGRIPGFGPSFREGARGRQDGPGFCFSALLLRRRIGEGEGGGGQPGWVSLKRRFCREAGVSPVTPRSRRVGRPQQRCDLGPVAVNVRPLARLCRGPATAPAPVPGKRSHGFCALTGVLTGNLLSFPYPGSMGSPRGRKLV